MIELYFKRRGPAGDVDFAQRSANCVPRPGEFVCLDMDNASYLVDRVEYLWYEAPKHRYNEQVWVWLK